MAAYYKNFTKHINPIYGQKVEFLLLSKVVIKSRRMRWAGHVARMGRQEVHTGVWWGDLREGDHLGDPGVDGRIILKWIFMKWEGAWTGLSWLRIGTGGGLL
jgi:hypothetical protein